MRRRSGIAVFRTGRRAMKESTRIFSTSSWGVEEVTLFSFLRRSLERGARGPATVHDEKDSRGKLL